MIRKNICFTFVSKGRDVKLLAKEQQKKTFCKQIFHPNNFFFMGLQLPAYLSWRPFMRPQKRPPGLWKISSRSFLGAAILTYTFLKYTLSLCTKVYLILGVCTKVYLKNLANLDADTKVYLE